MKSREQDRVKVKVDASDKAGAARRRERQCSGLFRKWNVEDEKKEDGSEKMKKILIKWSTPSSGE